MKTTIRSVLTLAALLLSSSIHAGTFYYFFIASTKYEGTTTQSLCQNFSDSTTYMVLASTKPSNWFAACDRRWKSNNSLFEQVRIYQNLNASCPSSLPYEWSDGSCRNIDEPPQECPDGQFMEGGECQIACFAGASFKLVLSLPLITDKAIDPLGGCNLEIDTTKKPECNFQTFMCNVYYKDTGVYNPDFSYENGIPPEPIPDEIPSPEPVTSETVDGPITETVNNPDGSTTTTETTTTTKVNEQGHLVEIIGDSIVLKNKAGEIVEILQQYQTNTYTDGTSQVTETVTTTATPNSITEVKKNLTDGSTTVITRTYNQGLAGSTTTTKTTTYDSTGKQTGSTSVSSGNVSETDGSGDGGGGEEGGELCGAPGQPICDVRIHENESDYDTSEIQNLESEFENMMQDLIDMDTSQILGVSEMSWTSPDYWIANFLNIPVSSNCSGVISSTIFGRAFVIDPCEKLIPLREILAWVFSIFTTLTIIAIIFHRKLL